MHTIIGTPEGTRDRLFSECAACRQVEKAVTSVFKRFGYSEVTTPNMEYYDTVLQTGHPLPQESMLKVIDRTGKILALRPDSTLAIGRVAATKMESLPLPLRLYYNQTVFRSEDINTGARTEVDQCGVELIGASGLRADLEILSMAIDALDACGLKDAHIEIGHSGYFSALLDALGLDEDLKDRLRTLTAAGEFTACHALLADYADTPVGKTLLAMPRLFGGVEVLDQADALCDVPETDHMLAYLRSLYQALDACGLSDRVRFDLGMIQNIDYYTGIIFRGFSEGAGSNVLSGGRYDRLIGRFGQETAAVGFGIDVESIVGCLPVPEHKKPETLIYYPVSMLAEAKALLAGQMKQTAMLSCADTIELACEEARVLGAHRLLAVNASGYEEVPI